MPRRIVSVLLALVLSAVLCACDLSSLLPTKEASSAAESLNEELAGDGTSYADFMQIMAEIKGFGDRAAEQGLPVHSEYYYSFAGASVSALRYAAEYILWLKGEGDTLASFTAGSRYSGWSTIAAVNYASPYPSYFEGLLLEIQGKYEESLEPFAAASVMPLFPEEGLDFYYLKKMSVPALYELRDRLRELEDQIYGAYSPVLSGEEWDRRYFDAEYLIGLSGEQILAGDYDRALWFAGQALKADPFDKRSWQNAAACAFYAEDMEQMGAYVDEGLAVFPDDESLQMLRRGMLDAVKEMEAGS